MANSTIVEIALALGLSPTVVLAATFALALGLSVGAGMAGAIGFRRFKPTPKQARFASVLLGALTVVPVSALLDVGMFGVASVGVGAGLFLAAIRVLQSDVTGE